MCNNQSIAWPHVQSLNSSECCKWHKRIYGYLKCNFTVQYCIGIMFSPRPAIFPAKVIEIIQIRRFVDQLPIQFAICAAVSAREVKPLISDKRFRGKREILRLIRKLRCVTVNSSRHISYSKEPKKSERRNHQGNCCLHKFGEKLQMLWLKLPSLQLTHSLVVRKIRWFKKVKYANTTTRHSRVKPWESSEIITRKITNVFVPSCSERWSNFLEMYNLWIKTLLNNWYITSFRFSSENDWTSKIPKTWLRSLAFFFSHISLISLVSCRQFFIEELLASP